MHSKRVAIIGAGVAGLSCGAYARMNGYEVDIFEAHTVPGGLCTGWRRKGFTIDGCLHWLVGSAPAHSYYRIWREIGALRDQSVVDGPAFLQVEDGAGPPIVLYRDLQRLEAHLVELFPADRAPLCEFVALARRLGRLDFPVDVAPEEIRTGRDKLRLLRGIAPHLGDFVRYGNVSVADFAARFQSPRLRAAFPQMLLPMMPVIFFAATLGWLHEGVAGYPRGGSLRFARNIERRVLDLGGRLHYGAPVRRIVVRNHRAVGVELADGTTHAADAVVAAGDLHATVFDLLGGRYVSAEILDAFRDLVPFSPLVYVGLGIGRPMAELPHTVAGLRLPTPTPFDAGGRRHTSITVHGYDHDPDMAPPGKSVLTVMAEADFDHWRAVARDPVEYRAHKERIGRAAIAALEARFPGLKDRVEMVDVATPMTFVRYTHNWRGSYEGFLPTPKNAMRVLPRFLPGLRNVVLAGHWRHMGGGLPPAAISGRETVQWLCHRDGRPFVTSLVD